MLTWPPPAAVSMNAAATLVRSPPARSLGTPPGEFDGGAGGVEHRGLGHEPVRLEVLQDLATLFGVGAVQADDDGWPDVDRVESLHDAVRYFLAPGDPAEDVDEDGLHLLVGVDDLEGVGHHLGVGATADVEEIGRRAADLVDDIARAHRQAGAVGDDADGAVETDVLQALLLGQRVARIELLEAPELVPLGMAECRAVVEGDLGVEGVHLALRSEDERVDLHEVGVALDEAAIELLQDVDSAVESTRIEIGPADPLV